MKLPPEDAVLYWDLMWSLQFFAGRRLGLLPDELTLPAYSKQPQKEKFKVREALYENPGLIDQYVQENPDGLSDEHLAIVGKWKDFVQGDFYVERHLKKYTVLIQEDRVYGVLGLYDSLEELFPKSYLPLYASTVLLPFKGRVIYDGLFRLFSVFFGSNYRAALKETYLRAKQRGEIITSFDGDAEATRGEVVIARDWRPEIEALERQASKLHGGAGQAAIHGPAFNLVKTSLKLALVAASEPENAASLEKELRKVSRALGRVEAVIYRM